MSDRRHLLAILPRAREKMPPAEFQSELRTAMLNDPGITLAQVASALGVTRQRVALMVGRLDRPNCATPNRPAPKRDAALAALADLTRRVAGGESAVKAAAALGISLAMARKSGFHVEHIRPAHGTQARFDSGCSCCRCRRTAGVALPRGPRTSLVRRAQVIDLLAWRDPDTDEPLRQKDIVRLSGVAQPMVSRIARTAEAD